MAEKKKTPEEKGAGVSGSTRSMRDAAEEQLARIPKSSPELKGQTAEEVLKSSESRYRRFFETVRDGILILDAETGTILDVNPFLIELLGFTHEQFLGKKLWEIGVFKDIAASKDNFKELQEKKYIHFEDLPLETADGRRIYAEFVSFVYEVEGKNVMQCNIRDITERKKAEEVLKSSESRYRRFFEAVRDGILILDAETGTILDVNPFLIELLGFTHEQFLGKKLWEIGVFKDIAASKDNFKELQERKYIHFEDLPLETADGRRIYAEFVSFVYEVEGKNVMQCNIRDITERKKAADMLALTTRKLVLMNDVAYQDIQNKVTALRGYAELSKDTKTEVERSAFIAKEEKILADIHQLIKNTKQYQEMGLDQLQWIPAEHEIQLAAAMTSRETPVSIDADLHGLELYSDPLIGRVFFHLVDNAIKHGSGLSRIRFSCNETPGGLVLVCEDDGAGIDPHKRATLFSRITGDKARFGLFFVKEFLLLSGMTIAETGEQGKGARFEITVPEGAWRIKGANE